MLSVEITFEQKKELIEISSEGIKIVADIIRKIQILKNTGNLCRIIIGGKIISSSANISSLDLTNGLKCYISGTKINDLRPISDVNEESITSTVPPPSYSRTDNIKKDLTENCVEITDNSKDELPWVPIINQDPTKYYEDLMQKELTKSEKSKVWSLLGLIAIEEIYNGVQILRENGFDVLPGRLNGFVNPRSTLREAIESVQSFSGASHEDALKALTNEHFDTRKAIELLISQNK